VLLGLSPLASVGSEAQRGRAAGLRWISNAIHDGGWAAFDKDNNWEFSEQRPFADHNLCSTPPAADITGRVMESLGLYGRWHHPAMRRSSITWCARSSRRSWYGLVWYIYAPASRSGLRAAGKDDREAHVFAPASGSAPPDAMWLGRKLAIYDTAPYAG